MDYLEENFSPLLLSLFLCIGRDKSENDFYDYGWMEADWEAFGSVICLSALNWFF
jgi:hypothetical protein